MPKLGMGPIRRTALARATISEIGRVGSLEVTVSQIARSAGVSSALAHHYFGSKEQMFVFAMRRVLAEFGAEVRKALSQAATPEDRVEAIVRASFSPVNFHPAVIASWLNFYVLARTSPEANRLLRIYHKRLHSNLVHALRPASGGRAAEVSRTVAALIDGQYLRNALNGDTVDASASVAMILSYLDLTLTAGDPA